MNIGKNRYLPAALCKSLKIPKNTLKSGSLLDVRNIDVSRIFDQSTFGNVHLRIIIACAIVSIADGYDAFIYGTLLPQLLE